MEKTLREIEFEHEWMKKICPLMSSVIFDNKMGTPVLFRVNCYGSQCNFWNTTKVEAGAKKGFCSKK